MGKVRSARKIPPGPVVSAMVKWRPYLRGISKSISVESKPPICTMLMTKSAPARACLRSRVAWMVGLAPSPFAALRQSAAPTWSRSGSTSM